MAGFLFITSEPPTDGSVSSLLFVL